MLHYDPCRHTLYSACGLQQGVILLRSTSDISIRHEQLVEIPSNPTNTEFSFHVVLAFPKDCSINEGHLIPEDPS